MDGFLANIENIPDQAFASSSCPLPEDAAEVEGEIDVCAASARWNENGIFWSPGGAGPYEFIEINFGRNVIVRAVLVRAQEGQEIPPFRVQYSPDGITWLCADYAEGESVSNR